MNRLGVGNFRLSGSKWLAEKRFFRLSQTTLFGELLLFPMEKDKQTMLMHLRGLSALIYKNSHHAHTPNITGSHFSLQP